jgi:hemolysin activation/secretion protein
LFRFRGFSDMIGVTLDHPIIRSRTQNLSTSLRYDFRDTITKSDLEANTEDQIGSVRAGLRYDFLSTFVGTSVNTADFLLSKGVGGFGASGEGDLDLSRPDGDPQYTKAELELQRLQKVWGPVNLLVGARGQVASEALLSSEEFGLGGLAYGRGYDPSEVVGDDGLAGKLEVQWTDPVTGVPYMEESQLFAFYDVGSVWNRDATTSQDKRNSLASTGVGARTTFAYGLSADAMVAVPMTAQPQTEDDEGPRVYFSLTKKF